MQNLWELEKISELENVSEEAVDLYPNKVTAFLFHALALKKSDLSAAKDFAREAQLIAGKNKALKDRVSIVNFWLKDAKVSQDDLATIDYQSFSESLYLELAGDLFEEVNEKTAQKLWRQAIEQGANPERLNKRIGLQ